MGFRSCVCELTESWLSPERSVVCGTDGLRNTAPALKTQLTWGVHPQEVGQLPLGPSLGQLSVKTTVKKEAFCRV